MGWKTIKIYVNKYTSILIVYLSSKATLTKCRHQGDRKKQIQNRRRTKNGFISLPLNSSSKGRKLKEGAGQKKYLRGESVGSSPPPPHGALKSILILAIDRILTSHSISGRNRWANFIYIFIFHGERDFSSQHTQESSQNTDEKGQIFLRGKNSDICFQHDGITRFLGGGGSKEPLFQNFIRLIFLKSRPLSRWKRGKERCSQ